MASIRRTSPEGIASLLSLSTNLKLLLIEEGSNDFDTLWNTGATLNAFTYTPFNSTLPMTAGSVTLTATGSQVILDHAAVTWTTLAAASPGIEHVVYAVDVGGGDAETLWVPLLAVDALVQPDGTDYVVDPGSGLVIWETDA